LKSQLHDGTPAMSTPEPNKHPVFQDALAPTLVELTFNEPVEFARPPTVGEAVVWKFGMCVKEVV
jgi:hypothetical protein